MTHFEFFASVIERMSPFLVNAISTAPEDWPVKGTVGYTATEMRVDFVRNFPNGAQFVAAKLARVKARKAAKKAGATGSSQFDQSPQDIDLPF
jgi:deoxyribose-phosphate aldolase